MQHKIKLYSDPGHSWGACKRKVLSELGILEKISTYSYQKGNTVYLEEDCDLPILILALEASGKAIQFVRKHTDRRSPIRSYDPFRNI